MSDKIIENNQVTIMGEVVSAFTFSHEVFGEGFYMVDVSVKRLSNSEDRIPVMISERLIDVSQDYTGEFLMISGQFRSYNRHEEQRNRLVLSVFAREVEFIEEELDGAKTNHILLDGYICKLPIYRKTPLGREIADLLLAVNRQLLYIFPALDSSKYLDMLSHLKCRCKSCISSPADTGDIIRFPIRTVDCKQKICNFPSKRCLSINRKLECMDG